MSGSFKRDIKIIILFSLLLFVSCLIMSKNASAFVDNGDGSVTVENEDSWGSIAAAYGLNYYNLAYANGCSPDTPLYAGMIIWLAEASANSYYNGTNDGSTTWYNGTNDNDYTWYGGGNQIYSETTTYTDSPVNEYSEYYSYYDEYGDYHEGYKTLAYDGGYVDYGTSTYSDTNSTTVSTTAPDGAYGSAYNINHACQLSNGVIIKSGETYSASAYLGDGGADMGFALAPCLNSDGTYYDAYGGGICQFTTYVHIAGKNANMTVLEANPHNAGDGTTGVTYASPEDQAMFNAGTSDLIMRNDTGHDLQLQCYYDDNGHLITQWVQI